MFLQMSDAYFVTDPLLEDVFREYFNLSSKSVRASTFGRVKAKELSEANYRPSLTEESAIEFITRQKDIAKQTGYKVLVTLCAGTLNGESVNKFIHFDYLPALIENAYKHNFVVIALVAGNWNLHFPEIKKLDETYNKYPEHILNFKQYVKFEDRFVKDYVDFYFRGYTDYSVPFTVYEACTFEKPVICLNTGFLPRLVSSNQIGEVIDMDFENIKSVLQRMTNNKCSYFFEEFLKSHTWETFSNNIAQEFQAKQHTGPD